VPRAIVFDGDDTLWRTEPLYDAARQRAREIVEEAGLDGQAWEERERRLDVDNVARLGHSMRRFPTSCVEAYKELCSEGGLNPDDAVADAVAAAATAAFEAPAPLLPHAREALAALRARGMKLILLTKGDQGLQRRRVEQSGLAPMFDVIEIVDAKTPETFATVLAKAGVAPNDALSVGNSVPSDVLPSLDAGLRPVWIDAHVWEYERPNAAVDERVIQLEDLAGLVEVAL
jgi:putative hydrolase of the HAD superfamily